VPAVAVGDSGATPSPSPLPFFLPPTKIRVRVMRFIMVIRVLSVIKVNRVIRAIRSLE
jgi:hypothetical protein